MASPKQNKLMLDILPSVTEGKVGNLDKLMSEILADPISHEEELESLLNASDDPIVELAKVGGVIQKLKVEEELFHQKILAHIHAPVVRAAINLSSVKEKPKPQLSRLDLNQEEKRDEIKAQTARQHGITAENGEAKARIIYEREITDFYQKPAPKPNIAKAEFNFAPPLKKNYSTLFFVFLGIFGIVAYGATLKHELVKDSEFALENLNQAGESLKNFDFSKAAENFRRSYEELAQASSKLNLAGAGLAGMFSNIPGASKLKSAKDIVEAGKLLASAGQSMSEAISSLSQTGLILDPNNKKVKPSKLIRQLKDALALSGVNLGKAKSLLANIDESIIPEDKQEIFHDFKDKIPMFEELLKDSQDYVDFFEGVIGIDEQKKYLLLFNNYSELRPTGGFPGTYGVISFSNGGLENFFVDDVYNLDGQLKENIIPPKQLQHITPTLGMRDSAWFVDFPSSAKKSMAFFAQEAGYKVNGVIALNPDVILDVLRAVGPINLPEYNMTLTADNFLENIQEEVEYGPNRTQPKQVVVDLGPKLLARLYSAKPEQWMNIFNAWMERLEEKDIIFYLEDRELENFAIKKGFGGEIKSLLSGGDYLSVNFTNIKGSKTDVVTDSAIEVDSRFEDEAIIHKVKIIRQHKGGDHEHGFYNRQNPAYVRVLLPHNAELTSFSGNDQINYKPLLNYGLQTDFQKDRDIAIFESNFSPTGFSGIDEFEESGLAGQAKKGLGFWMITNPNSTKEVVFEYKVPLSKTGEYNFYFQKQPGIDWKNFSFKISSKDIGEVFPKMNRLGDLYTYDEVLKNDLEIKIKFRGDK